MTKAELVDRVAAKTGFTKKDSSTAIDAVFDAMSEALSRGQKVQLVGFGSFEVRSRPARVGRNPQTGQPIRIPAKRAPVFRAGKGLREAVGV